MIMFYPTITSHEYLSVHLLVLSRQVAKLDTKRNSAEKFIIDYQKNYTRVVWPPATRSDHARANRFDVIHWTVISKRNIYFPDDVNVLRELTIREEMDLTSIKDFASSWLLSNPQHKHITSISFGDVYRRFNPSRGTDYVLYLETTSDSNEKRSLRVQLMKPLRKPKLVDYYSVSSQSKKLLS